jgi:hypothetical protein
MTISEAIHKRIPVLRLPEWEPSARLELPLTPNGLCGMVATVTDCSGTSQVFVSKLLRDFEDRYVAADARQETPKP